MMFFNGEYRFKVSSGLMAVLFAEGGKVFHRRGGLSFPRSPSVLWRWTSHKPPRQRFHACRSGMQSRRVSGMATIQQHVLRWLVLASPVVLIVTAQVTSDGHTRPRLGR
jgi:hypothetical protein